MLEKFRKVLMWFVFGIIGIAAFLLALSITTELLDADNTVNDVRIDLDEEFTPQKTLGHDLDNEGQD